MRSISSTTSLLILAAGLASSSSHAQGLTPLSPTDTRIERAANPGAAAPRGAGFGGELVTMRDEFENYPLNTAFPFLGFFAPPTSTTVPDGFEWGSNNLRGMRNVDEWVRVVDLAGSPVGGNASRALRIRTLNPQDPGDFFLGANLRWSAPLVPTVAHEVRVSSEMYLSAAAEQYTFEPVSTALGSVAGRLLWGGECVETGPGSCSDNGLPLGSIPTIYTLTPNPKSIDTGIFFPARFCTDIFDQPIPGCTPPAGFAAGDLVPPPAGAWTRFAAELSADNTLTFFIDYLDGQPEVAITSHPAISPQIDRVQWNAGFAIQDAFMIVDNVEASGPLLALPEPPPLDCPYLDDIEWLMPGSLQWQSGERWTVSPISGVSVVDDGENGNAVLLVNNAIPPDQYRRELSTQLPAASATLANDLVARIRVLTGAFTVRGVALFDDDDLAARVIFNLYPPDSIFIDNAVLVQANPDYDPIDPDGEPVDANYPVVGVDIVDTGYDWAADVSRTLEMRLSANGALRVSIDGQRVYAGAGAFNHAVSAFAFESENNRFSASSEQIIDDLALTCAAPSCATDFDFDDMTTFADLNAVLSSFGATGLAGFTPGDANADGAVNFADLNAVLAAFGTSCQ